MEELIKRFLACEEKGRFFSLHVKGRVVWDYLRYPLFESLLLRNLARPVKPSNSAKHQFYVSYSVPLLARLKTSILEFAALSSYLVQTAFRKSQKNNDIIVMNYDRKNLIDGKQVNIHFYPLIKCLTPEYSILLIDPSHYQEPVEENYPCEVLRSNLLYHRARLLSRFVRFSGEENEVFHLIQKVLEDEFKVTFNISKLARRFFAKDIVLSRLYGKIFDKVRPRLIIHSDTGNAKGWIEAAHQRGISVIDFQHSLMSPINILYRYPAGFEKLSTLSDHIFTFGEFWHDYYSVPARLSAVGFPFLEMMKQGVLEKKIAKMKSVVVISSMLSRERLEKIALDLSLKLPDYRILYKLRFEEYNHWRENYSAEFQARENIVVIDNNDRSLYELFAASRFQIGINSTALVEGLSFGLTTFIVRDGYYEEMKPLIERKAVFLVETADEISEKIINNERPPFSVSCNQIFRDGSLTHVRQAVNRFFP
ncbi:MAG: hypothetical protein HY539_01800 [Deltaproteobacteria bacterium]|nr:hypothetical protein [Deltaproteobacteria bacterium]